MGKKFVSSEMLKDWIEKYESGISVRRIASKCDFSHQTICTRLKEAGVQVSASKSLTAVLKGKPSNQKGRKRSQETCEKMSAARKGKPGKKGYRFTEEQKQKMSRSRLAYIEANKEKFLQDTAKGIQTRKKRITDEERVTRKNPARQ